MAYNDLKTILQHALCSGFIKDEVSYYHVKNQLERASGSAIQEENFHSVTEKCIALRRNAQRYGEMRHTEVIT